MGLNILVKYFSHFDPNGMLNKKLLETNLKRPSIIIILYSCIVAIGACVLQSTICLHLII